MKKIFVFILAFFLTLPCSFLLTGCGLTACAYVQFVPSPNEIVKYTAYQSNVYPHIILFNRLQTSEANYLLKISFKRNLGVDRYVDEKETLCVDIEQWSSMEIIIKGSYWSADKKIYLNNVDITANAMSFIEPENEWGSAIYYFEDFGLVQGNETEFINKIAYY